MNTTKIIRSKKDNDNPFTRISNSIANLQADEAGIMLQILSNSDSWVINKDVVMKRSKLGKVRFTKAWNHLKELGHITLNKLPMENGKFCYQYTIYEIPEVQNRSTVIDKPYTDYRSTENRSTVTGGTNNYQVINEDQETICSSGSDGLSTKVEVRPGKKNTGSNILDQENTSEDNLQIVPPPQLCFGSVRDNDMDQKEDPSIISPTKVPINTIPIIPVNSGSEQPEGQEGLFSSEICYSGKNKISAQTQKILDDLENIPNDVLKEMINIYYVKDYPNWEYLLKKKQLQIFLKETSKLEKPDVLTIELVTEYKNRLKREAYQKH